MGGYGSGRSYGKPLVEEALTIDFGWMLRQNLAIAGAQRHGTLRWSCGDEPAGYISFTCDMRDRENGLLELRFTVTRHATGERTDHIQRIRISYTRPHFGGMRWWLHCPKTGERVSTLHVPSGGDLFASRKAWRIAYRSQRLAVRDRPFEALFLLQRRLGCPEGWESPIRRPKGMWRKTFAKIEAEYWRLDEICAAEMAGVLANLTALARK